MNSRRNRSGFEESRVSVALRSVRQTLADWVGEDHIRSDRSPVEWVTGLLTLPFRLIWAVIVFIVQAWTTSRNGYAFIRSIPALAAAGIVFAAVWLINYRFDINANRTAARIELANMQFPDNPEYAEMYAEKLVEFRPDDPESKFLLASARQRSGKSRSAKTIMQQIASGKNSQTIRANVWLGQFYLSGKASHLTEEESADLAVEYFNNALDADFVVEGDAALDETELQSQRLFALLGLTDVYQKRNDLEQAEEYLREALSGQLVSLMQLKSIPRLIQMLRDLGREDDAQRQLKSFINRIRPLARQVPDLIDVWYVLVKCATMMKDYELAEEIIEDAIYQTVSDSGVRDNLKHLLAEISIIRADDIESIDDPESFKQKLFALCEALRINPRLASAYSRIIDFAAPKTLQQEKKLWIRDCIIGCPNPAVIHVILGMQEIRDGDFVQGHEHWKIADNQFELAQYLVNNLIEIAVTERSEEFGNLLDMITVALELFPDQAALYQTRGMYYKKKKQFQEAINDLQFAVEKLPNLIQGRQELVECYTAIGDTKNASSVQRDLDKLVQKLDDNQRQNFERELRQRAQQQEKEKESDS